MDGVLEIREIRLTASANWQRFRRMRPHDSPPQFGKWTESGIGVLVSSCAWGLKHVRTHLSGPKKATGVKVVNK